MLKSSLVAAFLLAPLHAAAAQQTPDAGQQIQQIPQPPVLERPAPDLPIAQSAPLPDADPDGPAVRVDSLQVTGETVFSDEQLIAATDFRSGSQLNLADLRTIAAQIARFYHSHGYFLAQVYLPTQDISGGAVTIAVIEGRYGSIDLRNESRLSDGVARGVLAGLGGASSRASTAATSSPARRWSGACCCFPIFPVSQSAPRWPPEARSAPLT